MRPLPEAANVLPLDGLLVADMRFPPVPRSPEHEHELPFVAVVLEGAFEKWLGRMSFGVASAGTYVMPGGVRHVDSYPQGVRLLTLELDPGAEIWEQCASLLARVRRLRAPSLTSVARQLSVELRATDEARTLAVEGLSLELVAAAMRSVDGASGRSRAPVWLNAVDGLLTARFAEPLRIADIAAAVHVHPAHLARVFRAHHGETIGHRIRRLRLDWAVGQLVEGELPLRAIAAGAGFAHQSHFSRAFKEHTGWSPALYRERQRARQARSLFLAGHPRRLSAPAC